MKSIEELPDLFVKLIEAVQPLPAEEYDPKFTPEAVIIVEEIADFARQTKGYREFASERADDYWKEPHTARDVWITMLEKIVNAPTQIHRDMSVLWHMPALQKAIEEDAAE